MKTKVKLVAVSIALCVIAAGATGCNKPAYGVHTNMPQDYYEIADESYFIDNTIEGCTAKKSETELLDNAGYSTEGRIFYSMSVEAVFRIILKKTPLRKSLLNFLRRCTPSLMK